MTVRQRSGSRYPWIVSIKSTRWRDVLVIVAFALAPIGLAFAGYVRVRTGQDWHSTKTTPERR